MRTDDPVVPAAHRQGDRQDRLARRAADRTRAIGVARRVHDAGAAALRRHDGDRPHRRRRRHRPRSGDRQGAVARQRAQSRQRRQLSHRRLAGRVRRHDHRAVARAADAGAQSRRTRRRDESRTLLWSFGNGPGRADAGHRRHLRLRRQRPRHHVLPRREDRQADLRAGSGCARAPTAHRRCSPTARSTSPTKTA